MSGLANGVCQCSALKVGRALHPFRSTTLASVSFRPERSALRDDATSPVDAGAAGVCGSLRRAPVGLAELHHVMGFAVPFVGLMVLLLLLMLALDS